MEDYFIFDLSLQLQISIDLEYIQHSYHTSILF